MTRTSMTKKSLQRRRFTFIILLALAIITSFTFGSKAYAKHKLKSYVEENYADEIKPAEDKKEVGDIKSKIDYSKDSLVAAHYPKIGKKNIDKNIEDIVESYISSFKEENKDFEAKDQKDMKDLHIDYESYNYKDKLVSLKFKINEGREDEKLRTAVYNLEDDKGVKLEDILIDESLSYISSQTIGQFASLDSSKALMDDPAVVDSLKNDIKNYSNFLMTSQGMELVLPQISKEETVLLSYDDLDMYSKYNLDNLVALSEEELEEKIANAQKGGRIRPGLDPNKPMVALTYDDGPSAKATAAILDQLKKYNSAATFFVLGQNAKIYPDLIQRMADEGHEIGNHSYSHKQLTKISVEELNKEVNDTQKAVSDIVGYEPTLLRPTYGAINDTVKTHVPMPLMLWSIDTLDWKFRDSQRVTNSILGNVKDGDIVLMHDLYDSTRDASLNVIPELVNKGYQLVTLSEMYELKGEELKAGGRYTNID